ncbi:hypothetical protein [Streptomyces sp. NBC_01754]|uniref:hypothetical protein n=1 Tax=Streptomyces sp. NBC_01754 TaxID=2975930 RepID=UPI003FA3AC3A
MPAAARTDETPGHRPTSWRRTPPDHPRRTRHRTTGAETTLPPRFPHDRRIRQAAMLLLAAERPVFYVGGGVVKAGPRAS